MDSLRNITSNASAPPGSDSGIDDCTSRSYPGSSLSHPIQPPTHATNHSQSDATSAALHDLSDVNLPSDDLPLTEDEALSEDEDGEVVAIEVLEAIERNATDNNRLFQNSVSCGSTSGRLPSKEEKQRQNEEIVIMESSSVSSETGSWESVFPQRTPSDACGAAGVSEVLLPNPIGTLRTKDKPRVLPEFSFSSKPMCSATAACFIDASSLMDDTEVYGSLTGPHLPDVGCCGPKPIEEAIADTVDISATKVDVQQEADLHSPNLSDEQKLLHRIVPEVYDIKDQFSLCSHHSSTDSPPDSIPPSSQDEGISIPTNSSDPVFRHRQDMERKQGHFLFRNSIQHYSGQVQLRNFTNDENQSCSSDLSLPSVYSTGSNDFGHHQFDSFGHVDGAGTSNSDAESGFFPDTPHNSIVMHTEEPTRHIVPPVVADQVCRGVVEQPADILRPFDSPSVRRKTETCPIMSGGLLPEDTVVPQKKKPLVRDRSLSTSLNSWVVDMSDCQQSPKSIRSEKVTSQSLDPRRLASGFFVDFSDSDTSLPTISSTAPESREDKKNLFSMFIDFGEKKPVSRKEPSSFTSRLSSSIQKQRQIVNSSDTESERERPSPIVRRTSVRKNNSDCKNRHSWNEPPNLQSNDVFVGKLNPRQFHSSVSMPDGDKPSTKNPIMSIFDKIPTLLQGANATTTSSMSIDSPVSPFDDLTSCKSMSAYSNNSGKSLTSNSVHSSVHGGEDEAVDNGVTVPQRRRRQDVGINETFDKSSRSSLPEELLSTDDTSPITDTDDVTYQNELEPDPNEPQEQHPESSQPIQTEHTMESLQATIERQQMLLLETVTEETTPAAAVNESLFVKLSDMDKPAAKFELHSDAITGANKRCVAGGSDILSTSLGAATKTTHRIERLFDSSNKTQRGGRNIIHSMSRSTGNNNLTNLASSSDNLKSLSRLFPHLSKELSSSLPSDIQKGSDMDQEAANMPNEIPNSGSDYNYYCLDVHDLSAASSVNSSCSRSAIDSADESSISYRQPRRLGEDLLKMFVQEIATDVTLEVSGRKMRAHKCILRSRCQYFAAILAGNWVQSAGNVIALSGYSYDSVHFALCHIYSGAAHPPEGISLIELAALADLLGLEGLKEVTAYALRMQYCHNFHKPCSGCLDGILRVFPVTLSYGLDELYRKCLRWTCKHYVSVWPTRFFAELPADLVGRCSQHLLAHMNSETVLDTIIDCELILSLISASRWAQQVDSTVRDIIDMAHAYIADHFSSLVASDGFLSLGQDKSWDIDRLENMLLRIASTLTPEQSCRSYQRISRLHAVLFKSHDPTEHQQQPIESRLMDGDIEWKPEFLRLVADIFNAVENCLVGQCSRSMRTNQWQRMDLELRKKIQQMAGIAETTEVNSRRIGSQLVKPLVYHSSSASNSGSYSTASNCNSSLSSVPTSVSARRSKDLYAVKLAIQAQSKREQEANRLLHREAKSHTTAERPTTLQFKPVRTAAERNAHKSLEVNKANIRAVADKTNHRRSQSENNPPTKTKPINEIRPRAVEPKPLPPSKLIEPVVNMSSSEDSSTRNSKLALNKRLAEATKSDMSRDSLASPVKHVSANGPQCTISTASEVDLSVDSLGGSMHSSIKSSRSNKSVSQESLVRFNATVRANNLNANRLRQPSGNRLSSNEHSPASGSTTTTTTATKSSRISSVNSTTSSTKDVALRRSTPQSTVPIRRSFVSAKSREILAAKQNAQCAVPSNKPTTKGDTSSGAVANSKRPLSYPTTLHLRRTAKLPTSQVETSSPATAPSKSIRSIQPPIASRQTKSELHQTPKTKASQDVGTKPNIRRLDKCPGNADTNNTSKSIRIKATTANTAIVPVSKKTPSDFDVDVLATNEGSPEFVAPRASTRFESKLERSSTFCKESSGMKMANCDAGVIE